MYIRPEHAGRLRTADWTQVGRSGEAGVPSFHLSYSELAAEATENYVKVFATATLAQVREHDPCEYSVIRGPMDKVADLMHEAKACTLILGETR